MMDSTTYIVKLPEALQEEIQKDVTTALRLEKQFTEENLERAMDGRLCDLEELLDISAYLGQEQGQTFGM